LLGGEQYQQGDRRNLRFDRVSCPRPTDEDTGSPLARGRLGVRAVAVFWPTGGDRLPNVTVEASWVDRDGLSHGRAVTTDPDAPPHPRDVDLAVRAARLWHASIVARALELNEKGERRRAESFVHRARRDFIVYVAGLPGVSDLVDSLHQLAHRVGKEWRTTSHGEAYVMARKSMVAREDLRAAKPSTYMDALSIDKR
jgi:hypothetical protein